MSDFRPMGNEMLEWALEAGFLGADGEAIVRDHLERVARGEVIAPPPADWQIADLSLVTLEPSYRCPICRDVGKVRREVGVGHPDFGKPVPCRCQTEDPSWQRAQWRRRMEHAQLPARLSGCSLDTFERRVGTGAAWEAIQAVLTAEREKTTLPWVVLYGGMGSGKTHLLAALAQSLLVTRVVCWADTGKLLERCKANNFARADEVLSGTAECPVLFLDEFGSQPGDDWGRIHLERIVNQRLETGLPTFLGMTMQEAELEGWSPRIADRFADARAVKAATLLCESYRRLRPSEEIRMSGWLDTLAPPADVDADGVVAETSLRAELGPRLFAAAWAMLDRYPPARHATVADRARWARVVAASAAIERGDAAVALVEIAAVERIYSGGE